MLLHKSSSGILAEEGKHTAAFFFVRRFTPKLDITGDAAIKGFTKQRKKNSPVKTVQPPASSNLSSLVSDTRVF